MRQQLEAAGAYEVRLEMIRSENRIRRETGMESGMGKVEALRAWLKQHPEYESLANDVLAEHQLIQEKVGGAA